MGNFNPDNYAPVDQRIAEFYADFPEGSIRTFVSASDEKSIMFEARCYRSLDEARDGIYTSGFAHETHGVGSPVNRTNYIENAETSAIGRALANLGYSGSVNGKRAPRPSREEMEQAGRRGAEQTESHQRALDFIKEVGDRCESDVMIRLQGLERPLKDAARSSWATLKRDRDAALTFARAVAEATGQPFNA